MQTIHWARHTLHTSLIAIAILGARSVSAQSPAPEAPSPSSVVASAPDSASYLSTGESMETIRVVAAPPKSRFAYERSLVSGNRLLAKQLKKYDRRILELEQRLDSMRIAAAHKWKEAREMESAAQAARERRIEMERRLALLEADAARASQVNAGSR